MEDNRMTLSQNELEKIGMQALDDFMSTFNSGDPKAWAATLNYPHVRLAGNRVQVWNTPEEYIRDNDVSQLKDKSGWGYSTWDWRKVVQAQDDKIHIAVAFTRYTPEHKKIVTYESFYIVTLVDGHWGTQSRSSFAGVIDNNTAF